LFQIGDKVRLNGTWQDNMPGVITKVIRCPVREVWDYMVKWDNGAEDLRQEDELKVYA